MLVDKVKDRVIRTNVELTALAHRLKVMRPWEKLDDKRYDKTSPKNCVDVTAEHRGTVIAIIGYDQVRNTNLKRTAVHEAGHAVIGRVLGLPCGHATIKSDGSHAVVAMQCERRQHQLIGDEGCFDEGCVHPE
jgi:hypothetical protein